MSPSQTSPKIYDIINAVSDERIEADITTLADFGTPHTLRHSFATHLMQQDVNIRYIRTALGHGSSKTTEIYIRVLGISKKTLKSPLDMLMKKGRFDNINGPVL